ncbi:Hypothetical protein POVR1_LOCUS497 [uncultured virus]|nr:Hypothetical protein POVR1_LOCUS497 [uncultured virus]
MDAELDRATTRSPTTLEDVDQFLKNHGSHQWFEKALRLSLLKDNATVVTYLTTYGNVFILQAQDLQDIFDRSLLFAVDNNCVVTIILMADACGRDVINDALNKALAMQKRERITQLLQAKINAIIKGTDYPVIHTHSRLRGCSRNSKGLCGETLLFTTQKPVTLYPLNPLNPSNQSTINESRQA